MLHIVAMLWMVGWLGYAFYILDRGIREAREIRDLKRRIEYNQRLLDDWKDS